LRAYIFLVVLAVLVPMALFMPFSGLLSYTWISYFNPHEYTFGFTRTLPVALMLVIPTLVGLLFTSKRKLPTITTETALLVLLWIWFVITTLNVYMSPTFVHHWDDTVQQLELVSKILLMAFVSLTLVTDAARLRLWYLVTAGSFAFFALKSSIFGVLTGGQFRVYGPEHSMLADNNDFGLAMNMALPMFLCLARTEQSKTLRWMFRLAIPMGVVSVVLTFSRGAMLGLMVLLFVWAMKSKYKVLGAIGLLFAVSVIFVAAPGAWIERMQTIRTAPQKDESAQSRFRAWELATRIAMDHPVFGGGFETFTTPLYAHYAIDDTHGPHSIYFQMLAEHGVPGLLIFLSLISSCYLSCRKISRRFDDEESAAYLPEYARMVQLSLVTFLVSGAFLGRAYFDLFYQIVASVIILKYLARVEGKNLLEREVNEQEETVEHAGQSLMPTGPAVSGRHNAFPAFLSFHEKNSGFD
jgi:probable O-glycosylation ligase (exosortase A-associated)